MAKKSGLGRGLSSIIDDKYDSQGLNFESTDKSRIVELKIIDVEPNKDQPRKMFDKKKLDELAESIAEHGVIQPIIVVKSGKTYQIVAGERRWRAAKQAGLKVIPAIVENYDDIKIREVALIENLQREDLNPVEEALGYKSLMETCNMTQEEVSKTVSKSRSAVANSLRLLNLSKPILESLEYGVLSVGHAKVILSLPTKEEQNALADYIVNNGLSVREAEEYVKGKSKTKKPKAKVSSEIKMVIKEKENDFSKSLGTKVRIKDNNGKGKIEISYYSLDEFERIEKYFKF